MRDGFTDSMATNGGPQIGNPPSKAPGGRSIEQTRADPDSPERSTSKDGSRLARWRHRARVSMFLYLSALLMMVASERVYWYWSGVTFESVVVLPLFYAVGTAAALWALALTGASRIRQLVLAGAVFAFVIEGVVTPVIYADGFLPVFAAMFVGWHGLVGLVGFWYLARRWLLAGRLRILAGASAVAGLIWGAWARGSGSSNTLDAEAISDITAEGLDAAVYSPGQFAVYAMAVGMIFAGGHWLIGYFWPKDWQPTVRSTRAVVLVAVGYMALAVLPAVIWAPLKLALLVVPTIWLMRRGSTRQPSIIEGLHGRVPLRRTAVLIILPVTAALAYWFVEGLGLNDDGLATIYWLVVAAQVVGGGVAYIWAAVSALRAKPEWNMPSLNPVDSEVVT